MANARAVKEIFIVCINEVGMLAKISNVLKKAKINIHSLSAFVITDNAHFRMVVDNTRQAIKKIKEIGLDVWTKDVLMVEFDNKVGTLAVVAQKLRKSGIDISYCYATSADGDKVIGIFSTRDDKKALRIINK